MKFSNIRRSAAPLVAAGLLAAGVVSAPLALAAGPGNSGTDSTPSAGGSNWTTDSKGDWQRTDRHEQDTYETYYANCSEVIAAGKAPLYAGQPGYDLRLDPNHTGVACAPWQN
ncbi:excalibur calcium-binding domain-containing protein [Nocardia pseudobrasiliensis]|uniref:excalibur calcium-binding domain-containing protein n=1 Tax=Nocardia pseudobrasiliensis TaxID=45979 RepID=UPI00082E02B5|nr:excalibur calcium-binding domain-containing protein [Nocardia pseudobrasiliensis]